jgi:hypothetical protein
LRKGVAIAALGLSCSSPSSATAPPAIAIARAGAAPRESAAGDPSPDPGTDPPPRAGELPSGAPAAPAAIAWEADERDARERARRRGLPRIIYIRADWSATALEMERKAWSDPRVADAARRFVALKLDVSSAEGDAERYGVERIPSTLVLDADGRTIAVLGGAAPADALLAAMRRAVE